MDKNIAGLLGAVGALAAAVPAQAAVSPQPFQAVMQAESYADLLRPIPNALAVLQTAPAIEQQDGDALLLQVDDHHHHHRTYRRRRYRRHHHHHSQMMVIETVKPV
jgi:hypothetical protein